MQCLNMKMGTVASSSPGDTLDSGEVVEGIETA